MADKFKIEMRPIDDLVPYARNPRKNDGAAVDKVAASIKEFGWRQPIVVDGDGVIIAGHTRHKAARQLGLTEVPVHDAGDLTETQARAFRIADNRTGEESTWDDELLRLEFDDLGDDIDLTGFDDEEISALEPETIPPDGDPDATPDPPAEPVTVEGDLWTLGEHRVLCGDSSTLTDLDHAVNGVNIGAVIADPPYGMRLNADFSGMKNKLNFTAEKGVKAGRKYDDVIGDDADFDAAFLCEYFAGVNNQIWFGADYYSATLPNASHSGAWLVWDKRIDESADLMFGSTFELIWSKRKCKRDMLRHKWAGIFGFEKEPIRGRVHPNQKPVALYTDIIDRFTDAGATIYDPFLGSGNVIITAESTGRVCYGTEIAPQYVDVIVKRWQTYTGREAVLDGDGRTFNEIAAERGIDPVDL